MMTKTIRNLSLIITALAFTGCATLQNVVETSAISSGKVGLSEFSTISNASAQTVDHTALDQFLSKYLITTSADNTLSQGANLIRYQDVSDTDEQALIAYINRLQATPVSTLNRNEQLAFWINLYNAETIRVILENYPVSTIRDIQTSALDFNGPWNDTRLTVEGTDLSLGEIENKIVRPIFKDPRIHYGLNCAAIGCPNLRPQAYKAYNLDSALDEQTRAFINNPRGVNIEDGKLTVSRIFLWYENDYGDSKADVISHLSQYAQPALKNELAGISTISKYEYDWSLNDAGRLGP